MRWAWSSNRKKSWNAPASRSRQSLALIDARSTPSTVMRPLVGVYMRAISFTSVDFPEPGDLTTSTYTVARLRDGAIAMTNAPVEFTLVKPGETIMLDQPAAAE